jgi:hypothetical protein
MQDESNDAYLTLALIVVTMLALMAYVSNMPV